MSFNDLKGYLIWGGVFQALLIEGAIRRADFDFVFYSLLTVVVACRMAYVSYRKDNPKINRP